VCVTNPGAELVEEDMVKQCSGLGAGQVVVVQYHWDKVEQKLNVAPVVVYYPLDMMGLKKQQLELDCLQLQLREVVDHNRGGGIHGDGVHGDGAHGAVDCE